MTPVYVALVGNIKIAAGNILYECKIIRNEKSFILVATQAIEVSLDIPLIL